MCSSDWQVWFSRVFSHHLNWMVTWSITDPSINFSLAYIGHHNGWRSFERCLIDHFATTITFLQGLPAITTCLLPQLDNIGKRMSYDSNFKLKVILKAKELGSNHKAADFFRMTEKMIQDWHKKEDQLKTVKKTDKRLKQCGRSIHDRGFDDSIMQWLSDAPDDGHTMTGVTLQLQVWHVSTDPSLKASTGWLEKFKKWHILSTWWDTMIVDWTEDAEERQREGCQIPQVPHQPL